MSTKDRHDECDPSPVMRHLSPDTGSRTGTSILSVVVERGRRSAVRFNSDSESVTEFESRPPWALAERSLSPLMP